ncbi:MAG TPA: hypothetical protein VGW78_06165 [Candidatus Babeliales bacterium]|jgi:hypothetical protein|nr:hypothetical protein [Candidatus Babeliales bacterium]
MNIRIYTFYIVCIIAFGSIQQNIIAHDNHASMTNTSIHQTTTDEYIHSDSLHNQMQAEPLIDSSADLYTQHEEPNTYLLDCIRAIIVTTEGTELVTQSDLERPNFFGRLPTLQEEIEERLIYQDALKYHITITEDQIDRQIAVVMRQNNLTLDQLKELCTEYGMTYQELRDKLARVYTVNTMKEHIIESKLIINRSEIIAYYEANPEYTEVIYELQRTVVPYAQDKNAQKAMLQERIATKQLMDDIGWSITFSVEYSAVSDAKSFIHSMHVGDVVLADERIDGFELYRLVGKKEAALRSLEERYMEIDHILRRPMREKLMENYRRKLFEESTIVYL